MTDHLATRPLWPQGAAREAAVFAAASFVAVDLLLIFTRSGPVGDGALFNGWGLVKAAVIVGGLGYLAARLREPALGALAFLMAVVAADEVLAVTAEIGKWLAEGTGVGTGELGVNSQFMGRLFIAALAGGPVLYLAPRAPAWLRRALFTLLATLGVLFVVAVGVDALTDAAGRNLDEGLEEPIVSAMAALTIGLVVEYVRRRRIVAVTRPRGSAPRSRSRRR